MNGEFKQPNVKCDSKMQFWLTPNNSFQSLLAKVRRSSMLQIPLLVKAFKNPRKDDSKANPMCFRVKKSFELLSLILLLFTLQLPSLAGGVDSYVGNSSSTEAAISDGIGSSSSAVIRLDINIPTIIASGIYNTSGLNTNNLFATPASNFPGGTTFTAAESQGMLITSEGNLSSKFNLDLTLDPSVVIGHIVNSSNIPGQDLVIKGAAFTNSPSTNIGVYTSVNTMILTGGTGSPPQVALRTIGGVPGGGASAIAVQTSPATGLVLDSSKRNSLGYARYSIIADFSEASVDSTTQGDWSGDFTITVTGI